MRNLLTTGHTENGFIVTKNQGQKRWASGNDHGRQYVKPVAGFAESIQRIGREVLVVIYQAERITWRCREILHKKVAGRRVGEVYGGGQHRIPRA